MIECNQDIFMIECNQDIFMIECNLPILHYYKIFLMYNKYLNYLNLYYMISQIGIKLNNRLYYIKKQIYYNFLSKIFF